jgi:hypothetical protein
MTAGNKKLLQTFERMNGGVNGHGIAPEGWHRDRPRGRRARQVEHAAKLAGLCEVEMDRIQSVAVLPRCSILDEVKGD